MAARQPQPITGAVTPSHAQRPDRRHHPDIPSAAPSSTPWCSPTPTRPGRKGASAVLDNSNATNLPRQVDITIQEIAVPITANTVSNARTPPLLHREPRLHLDHEHPDRGTVQNHPGLLEINSISVGYRQRMAGYVWRAGSPTPQY